MRYLYSLLFYLCLPYIFFRLWRRGARQPEYRRRISERFGYYPFKLEGAIWVHAVSVGETLAAVPLIKALKKNYPDRPLLVTTMTPTGAAQVKAALGDSVIHAYLCYDLPDAVNRFLNSIKPKLGIIIETELWPNLLAACQKRNIPMCLVNARLSSQSAKGYQRIAGITRAMLQSLAFIAAHGESDAKRFIALGAPSERVHVTGNIKFDLALPEDFAAQSFNLRKALGEDRFIWIAASTHAGEEEIVLTAHQTLRQANPRALLILAPRHPDRFAQVAALCEKSFVVKSRSKKEICTEDTAVYLGDTMGELLQMYAAADAAFVGGSLVARGGHNILEPGALGKPILTGPHVTNFKEISELFNSANALIQVADAETLATHLMQIMQDPNERAQLGTRARNVVEANRGALAKQLALVYQVAAACSSISATLAKRPI